MTCYCESGVEVLVGRLQRYRLTRVWCSMCSFRCLAAKDAKRYKPNLGKTSACLSGCCKWPALVILNSTDVEVFIGDYIPNIWVMFR